MQNYNLMRIAKGDRPQSSRERGEHMHMNQNVKLPRIIPFQPQRPHSARSAYGEGARRTPRGLQAQGRSGSGTLSVSSETLDSFQRLCRDLKGRGCLQGALNQTEKAIAWARAAGLSVAVLFGLELQRGLLLAQQGREVDGLQKVSDTLTLLEGLTEVQGLHANLQGGAERGNAVWPPLAGALCAQERAVVAASLRWALQESVGTLGERSPLTRVLRKFSGSPEWRWVWQAPRGNGLEAERQLRAPPPKPPLAYGAAEKENDGMPIRVHLPAAGAPPGAVLQRAAGARKSSKDSQPQCKHCKGGNAGAPSAPSSKGREEELGPLAEAQEGPRTSPPSSPPSSSRQPTQEATAAVERDKKGSAGAPGPSRTESAEVEEAPTQRGMEAAAMHAIPVAVPVGVCVHPWHSPPDSAEPFGAWERERMGQQQQGQGGRGRERPSSPGRGRHRNSPPRTPPPAPITVWTMESRMAAPPPSRRPQSSRSSPPSMLYEKPRPPWRDVLPLDMEEARQREARVLEMQENRASGTGSRWAILHRVLRHLPPEARDRKTCRFLEKCAEAALDEDGVSPRVRRKRHTKEIQTEASELRDKQVHEQLVKDLGEQMQERARLETDLAASREREQAAVATAESEREAAAGLRQALAEETLQCARERNAADGLRQTLEETQKTAKKREERERNEQNLRQRANSALQCRVEELEKRLEEEGEATSAMYHDKTERQREVEALRSRVAELEEESRMTAAEAERARDRASFLDQMLQTCNDAARPVNEEEGSVSRPASPSEGEGGEATQVLLERVMRLRNENATLRAAKGELAAEELEHMRKKDSEIEELRKELEETNKTNAQKHVQLLEANEALAEKEQAVKELSETIQRLQDRSESSPSSERRDSGEASGAGGGEGEGGGFAAPDAEAEAVWGEGMGGTMAASFSGEAEERGGAGNAVVEEVPQPAAAFTFDSGQEDPPSAADAADEGGEDDKAEEEGGGEGGGLKMSNGLGLQGENSPKADSFLAAVIGEDGPALQNSGHAEEDNPPSPSGFLAAVKGEEEEEKQAEEKEQNEDTVWGIFGSPTKESQEEIKEEEKEDDPDEKEKDNSLADWFGGGTGQEDHQEDQEEEKENEHTEEPQPDKSVERETEDDGQPPAREAEEREREASEGIPEEVAEEVSESPKEGGEKEKLSSDDIQFVFSPPEDDDEKEKEKEKEESKDEENALSIEREGSGGGLAEAFANSQAESELKPALTLHGSTGGREGGRRSTDRSISFSPDLLGTARSNRSLQFGNLEEIRSDDENENEQSDGEKEKEKEDDGSTTRRARQMFAQSSPSTNRSLQFGPLEDGSDGVPEEKEKEERKAEETGSKKEEEAQSPSQALRGTFADKSPGSGRSNKSLELGALEPGSEGSSSGGSVRGPVDHIQKGGEEKSENQWEDLGLT